MKSFAYTIIALGLVAGCGGGGATVDIVGKTPVEQAEDIADAVCTQLADCGEISIDCVTDPETQMLDCTGTIETVEYDACVAETEPEILGDLEGCELTAEQEQQVQDCINARTAQSCVSQEELDAYADGLETGSEEPLREDPAVCEGLEALFETCGTPS